MKRSGQWSHSRLPHGDGGKPSPGGLSATYALDLSPCGRRCSNGKLAGIETSLVFSVPADRQDGAAVWRRYARQCQACGISWETEEYIRTTSRIRKPAENKQGSERGVALAEDETTSPGPARPDGDGRLPRVERPRGKGAGTGVK